MKPTVIDEMKGTTLKGLNDLILNAFRGLNLMKKGKTKTPKTAKEFDQYFENNDVAYLLDASTKRINVDLPSPMLNRLDAKAHQLGLTRQSLLKYWIAERLKMA